jgi:hypothetical protein
MATSVEDAVARLTDFAQPMDVAIFEQLVSAAYTPGNPQQQASGHALVHLQEHPGTCTVFAFSHSLYCFRELVVPASVAPGRVSWHLDKIAHLLAFTTAVRVYGSSIRA